MEIKKIEKSDFVMFPRMQHRGLQFRHVERDAPYALSWGMPRKLGPILSYKCAPRLLR